MKGLVKRTNGKVENFHKKRKGMEVLQLAIIIVLAVGLIGVVATIMGSVKTKLESARGQIETGMNWEGTD